MSESPAAAARIAEYKAAMEIPILGEKREETPMMKAMRIERETLLAPYFRRDTLENVLTGTVVPDGLTSDERATWDMLLGDLRTIYDQSQARLPVTLKTHAEIRAIFDQARLSVSVGGDG